MSVSAGPQSSSAPAGVGNETEQVLSREKRRIRELEEELEELWSSKQARRSDTATIVNKGQAFRRVITLFENPTDLVREYDRRAKLVDEGLDDERHPFPHSTVQNRVYRGFQELLEIFPWIKPKLTDSELAVLESIFKDLRKGGDGARGDDAASLKKEVVIWLTDLYAPIIPPISPSLKSDRGIDHDITGRLLCPVEYDWNDAQVRKNVRERHPQFVVSERSWPRFMYDTRHVYDPNNIEKGLFKSTLLLKAFKQIFTSPTSAQEVTAGEPSETRRRTRSSAKKPTHSHVDSLIGMQTVKPRAIAYAAVQLRFALSAMTCWGMVDGDFHASAFYNNIVDYFEAPPGPVAKKRVQELLLWWDRKVFGFYRELPRVPEFEASLSVGQMDIQRAAAEVPAVPAQAH